MRFLLALALSTGAFAQCSIESVHGSWAYQNRGIMMVTPPGGSTATPVPFVGTGTLKADVTGAFTINGLLNLGGTVQPMSGSGIVDVDPSCTATSSYSVSGTSGSSRLVVLGNGTEMRMIETSGGSTGITEFRRLSWGDAECTQDMVRGVYSGSAEGTMTMIPPGAKQAVAISFSMLTNGTYDWNGGSGLSTISLAGTILDAPFPQMSATVNSDCTGTVSWSGGPKGMTSTGENFFILLDNGNEFWVMQTKNSAGPTLMLGRMKRTSVEAIAPKW